MATNYIDRNALIEHIRKDPLFDLVEQYGITGVIESFPAADVQPVKHAAWDYAMPVDGPERNRYRCSRCSGFALLDYWGNDVRSRYCPECGAIMDDLGKKYWVCYDGELILAED